jgi:hypothetical protein
LLIFLFSCKQKTGNHQINFGAIMKQLTDTEIQNLSTKKIFFGHMSVGNNLINGLDDLKLEDQRMSNFSIIKISAKSEIMGPGFYHKINGKNGNPMSKCDAFKNFLIEDSTGSNFDIVSFKLCYVDIKEDTDIKKEFDKYEQTITEIKNTFPNLKIFHTTIPLLAHNFSLKNRIKNILTGDLANIKRNQFNNLILDKYIGVDPIFDLAKIESTYPDQKREFFTSKGEQYFSLIMDYSYDGGHLNELGRKWAAAELIKVLIDI